MDGVTQLFFDFLISFFKKNCCMLPSFVAVSEHKNVLKVFTSFSHSLCQYNIICSENNNCCQQGSKERQPNDIGEDLDKGEEVDGLDSTEGWVLEVEGGDVIKDADGKVNGLQEWCLNYKHLGISFSNLGLVQEPPHLNPC